MKKILFNVIFFLFSLSLLAQQDVEFKSIKFFEGPDNAPDKDSRVYNTVFDKSSARFIWCEVTFKNTMYNIRDQYYEAKWTYYNPDGSVKGTVKKDYNIKKEWETTWHQSGWGWDESGNWKAGVYKVRFYLDDNQITEKSFTVKDYNYNAPTITYQSIKFFESPKTVTAADNRVYSTTFTKSSTRYIFYEISVKNLLYNSKENPVTLTATYYYPDGSIMGSPVLDHTLPIDWEIADMWHGWGWDESGNWKPGTYRVEITYQGNAFATGYFTVTND